MEQEPKKIEESFFNNIQWDKVSYNKIDEKTFNLLLAKYKKVYATFLGNENEYTFFMMKKLSWSEFRDIRSKNLDKDSTHDYILNNCIIHPKMDAFALNEIDAGMALTLVYQILSISNFIPDPKKSLELLLECS